MEDEDFQTRLLVSGATGQWREKKTAPVDGIAARMYQERKRDSTANLREFWLINDDRELFAVQSVKYLGGMGLGNNGKVNSVF